MLTFDAGSLRISLDDTGQVVSPSDVKHKQERLAAGVSGPLLRLGVGDRDLPPIALKRDRRRGGPV